MGSRKRPEPLPGRTIASCVRRLRTNRSPLPSPFRSPGATIASYDVQAPDASTFLVNPNWPAVGTTRIRSVALSLTNRSGHFEPITSERAGSALAACGVIGRPTGGTVGGIGVAVGFGVGLGVEVVPLWIFAAICRIFGICAYRYLPGQAVWPTSRWPLIACR